MNASEPTPFARPLKRRLYGVHVAICRGLDDPLGQGRILVELPWVGEVDAPNAQAWARFATMFAGSDHGSWFLPDVGDEVLLSFVGGDARWPVVIGGLWNGADAPPESMDSNSDNHVKSLTTRSGHHIAFDDTPGSELVEIVTQGEHVIALDDANRSIEIRHQGGSTVVLEANGSISITATNEVEVTAPSGMKVTAPMVTVDAGLSKFSGVVKAESVITNAVVSSTYTVGAGNIW